MHNSRIPNTSTSYEELNIKYQSTILDSYQIVVLHGGRLQIPTPTWENVYYDSYGLHSKYCYKYYVRRSKRYDLLRFLYDPQNSDHRYAFMHLQEIVVFFDSDKVRLAFETYIEEHHDLIDSKINEITRSDHIGTDIERKTEVYYRTFKGWGCTLLIEEWRNMNRCIQ